MAQERRAAAASVASIASTSRSSPDTIALEAILLEKGVSVAATGEKSAACIWFSSSCVQLLMLSNVGKVRVVSELPPSGLCKKKFQLPSAGRCQEEIVGRAHVLVYEECIESWQAGGLRMSVELELLEDTGGVVVSSFRCVQRQKEVIYKKRGVVEKKKELFGYHIPSNGS